MGNKCLLEETFGTAPKQNLAGSYFFLNIHPKFGTQLVEIAASWKDVLKGC